MVPACLLTGHSCLAWPAGVVATSICCYVIHRRMHTVTLSVHEGRCMIIWGLHLPADQHHHHPLQATNHLGRRSFFSTSNEAQWLNVRKGTAQAFCHQNIRWAVGRAMNQTE